MLLFLFSYGVSALFAVIHLHCSFLLATAAAAAADVAADCCCCWLYNFTLLRTGITCTRIHTHMYFNCTVSNLFFSATYSSHELWNFDTRRKIIANNINKYWHSFNHVLHFFFCYFNFISFHRSIVFVSLEISIENPRTEWHGLQIVWPKVFWRPFILSVICVNWKAVQPKVKKRNNLQE